MLRPIKKGAYFSRRHTGRSYTFKIDRIWTGKYTQTVYIEYHCTSKYCNHIKLTTLKEFVKEFYVWG